MQKNSFQRNIYEAKKFKNGDRDIQISEQQAFWPREKDRIVVFNFLKVLDTVRNIQYDTIIYIFLQCTILKS